MIKVHLVMRDAEPIRAFLDKREAQYWAEDKFGSRQDGICVDGIEVRAFEAKEIQ